MTETDELRRLLDERGVEWEDMSIRPYACTSWRDLDGELCTALEGADDIPDGKLSVQALLTPEQAVEATLGRGTCYLISALQYGEGCKECSACGAVADEYMFDGGHCPNCRAKVIN